MNDAEREAGLRRLGISPALSRAYDVLDAAGLVTQGRLRVCLAAERQGLDPVECAHKLVAVLCWDEVRQAGRTAP